MSAYKLVYFVPDPFSGVRLPVAALVEEKGGVKVARSLKRWTAASLGGRGEKALLSIILDKLEGTQRFNALPETLGPCALLDKTVELPDAISQPVEWVQQHVLPRPSVSE